jgi:histidinol dehydrogenase
VGPTALALWLKLDAGTEAWYKTIDRSAVPFGTLIAKIRSFAAQAPFTVQTMLCTVNRRPPDRGEAAAWERLVLDLAAGLTAVQIYGKARPAPEDPLAEALPPAILEDRAASLRQALEAANIRPGGKPLPVEEYL